jgi:membrane dipeptidase
VGANYVKDNHAANRAMQMIDTTRYDIAGRHPQDFMLAYTAADAKQHTNRPRSPR